MLLGMRAQTRLQVGLRGWGAISVRCGTHFKEGCLCLLCPACHCSQQIHRVALILHGSTPCSASLPMLTTLCTPHLVGSMRPGMQEICRKRMSETTLQGHAKNTGRPDEFTSIHQHCTPLVICQAPADQQEVQQRRASPGRKCGSNEMKLWKAGGEERTSPPSMPARWVACSWRRE